MSIFRFILLGLVSRTLVWLRFVSIYVTLDVVVSEANLPTLGSRPSYTTITSYRSAGPLSPRRVGGSRVRSPTLLPFKFVSHVLSVLFFSFPVWITTTGSSPGRPPPSVGRRPH